MKKIVLVISVLILGISIVGISIWRGRAPLISITVEGQEEVTLEESTDSADSIVLEEKEDYSLPYTGMLPDHPLYFLKMVRDRIQLWLTRNPIKRADLMLHYADKRIAASLALAEKGKSEMAISTATKAEKYMERSMSEMESLDSSDNEVMDFYRKLYMASGKHKLVLVGIRSRVPEETVAVLDSTEETCDKLMQKADEVGGFSTELEENIESQEEIMKDETEESSKGASVGATVE